MVDKIIGKVDNYIVLKSELELAYQPHLTRQWQAAPVINGQRLSGTANAVHCPYELSKQVGSVDFASAAQAAQALLLARPATEERRMADAINRARSTDRAAINAALAGSTGSA